jgi:Histidine kinase-, DNA gyrase B-, and HSP90-like ATPase
MSAKNKIGTKDVSAAASSSVRRFALSIKTSPRVLTEHLGRQKYATPAKAIAELIMNGFDADAKLVQVDLNRNALGLIVDRIVVTDNGAGMTEWDLKERFQTVGVQAKSDGKSRLGQFGVGRMAVFRLGSRSQWRTVSLVGDVKTEFSFQLDSSSPDEFPVEARTVSARTPTGTTIVIEGLLDEQTLRLTDKQLSWDLFSEFASYLFAWTKKHLQINGELIELADRVIQRNVEELGSEQTRVSGITTLEHLLLKAPVHGSRVPEQLILTAKGVAVERLSLSNPPAPNYLALVSSPYLDKLVGENRAAFINMDGGMVGLKKAVDEQIEVFGEKYRRETAEEFIDRARQKEFYPFHGEPQNAVTRVEQTLYDSILTLVNDAVNVENLGAKQQRLIFNLLHRALRDEDLLQVLNKVAGLSADDIAQFRELLERTTLQSIIRLSSEVTERLTFLDVLKDVVYGEGAVGLRERSELHKILEPNCWIFGPQYHLATSDKAFRKVIARQRLDAGLDPVPEDVISAVVGIDQVPDLFLAAHRDYHVSDGHRHEHLMIEIKRPTQKISPKVVSQGESYASVLNACSEFDPTRTEWDLFLVSGEIEDNVVNLKRRKADRPFGHIDTMGNVRLWAFTWGEIIEAARDEMRMVRDKLEMKSLELSSSEYLQKHYPKVFPPTGAPTQP